MNKELEALYTIVDDFISKSMYSTKEVSDALDMLYELALNPQALLTPTSEEIKQHIEKEYRCWEVIISKRGISVKDDYGVRLVIGFSKAGITFANTETAETIIMVTTFFIGVMSNE